MSTRDQREQAAASIFAACDSIRGHPTERTIPFPVTGASERQVHDPQDHRLDEYEEFAESSLGCGERLGK
jgi:hypothetical protein